MKYLAVIVVIVVVSVKLLGLAFDLASEEVKGKAEERLNTIEQVSK